MAEHCHGCPQNILLVHSLLISTAAVNAQRQMSVWFLFSISWVYTVCGIAGSFGSSVLRTTILFSTAAALLHISPSRHTQGLEFLQIFPNSGYFQILFCSPDQYWSGISLSCFVFQHWRSNPGPCKYSTTESHPWPQEGDVLETSAESQGMSWGPTWAHLWLNSMGTVTNCFWE